MAAGIPRLLHISHLRSADESSYEESSLRYHRQHNVRATILTCKALLHTWPSHQWENRMVTLSYFILFTSLYTVPLYSAEIVNDFKSPQIVVMRKRIGCWPSTLRNIVTSWKKSAFKAIGLESPIEHDERYKQADEYLIVLYKLWEGSWSNDAIIKDIENDA